MIDRYFCCVVHHNPPPHPPSPLLLLFLKLILVHTGILCKHVMTFSGGTGTHEVTNGEEYTITAQPYKDYTITIAAMTSIGTGPKAEVTDVQTEEWCK